LSGIDSNYGLESASLARIRQLCSKSVGLESLWVFGSRARGDFRDRSDLDLAVNAPDWSREQFNDFAEHMRQLPMVYPLDIVHWQKVSTPEFKAQIEKDRQVLWQPSRTQLDHEQVGNTQLKRFQSDTLVVLDAYLNELAAQHQSSAQLLERLEGLDGAEDLRHAAADFPKKTWGKLKECQLLPPAFSQQPHSSRFDGAGRAIPNVCLKIPTGGGKTLLAAASVGRVFSSYLKQHTGLVLWIVPNEAIYQQTLKTLKNRDHPYRQMLNAAGAGRVKILEKTTPLSKIDTDSHLCVMLLMLASAARQSKETLRFFRDRGNVLGFVPREDDLHAHAQLLAQAPNLDAYAPWGTSQEEARATLGAVVKSSLGNVMRLLRPMVVIDEGHHAYTENALQTIDGFNPCFMLELSATPRVNSDKGSGSNILVNVRGTDLDEAQMIKLPIHVDIRVDTDWQSCLSASLQRLRGLQKEAEQLQNETNRYIRPILLVQVERTGKDLRDAGFIHADDVKVHLLQLGLTEKQIAIKTSERNDLNAPENIDLLSPQCEIRAIITKQALQEGWDCPFAYVLCALAASKDLRSMTQLVGRILRLPHVAKTGREALDACYVVCHSAKTVEVVKAIKDSLEKEGMGDLGLKVSGAASEALALPKQFKRRKAFEGTKIYLPRVTWVERDAMGNPLRRPLDYDSDILAALDWTLLEGEDLLSDWVPATDAGARRQLKVGLELLASSSPRIAANTNESTPLLLDHALLVRGLLDVLPNPWIAWKLVHSAIREATKEWRFSEHDLALDFSGLLERLRERVQIQRDALAQAVFEEFAQAGKIEFSLRADAQDYELPQEFELQISGQPQPLIRDDAQLIERSLFEPALTALTDSGLERDVACYLDSQAALMWWHRNVAKAQYGLQGWKRHKVYPDFVFAKNTANGKSKVVVLETKGLHLAGSQDTDYKRQLLEKLSAMFRNEKAYSLGSMTLEDSAQALNCDLLFDQASWKGSLAARHFADAAP
jgi:type III restriction enzyme